MTTHETADYIKLLAEQYETEEFLVHDPSRFMHQVEGHTNRETTAFVAAALSYGSRKQFFPKISNIIEMAAGDVDGWVRSGDFLHHIPDDDRCFYRLYTNAHMRSFLAALRSLLAEHGSLGQFARQHGPDAGSVVEAFCKYFAAHDASPIIPRSTSSACKRLCMYMRWMVRDGSPVDLGLWTSFIDKRTLIMPLDTHVLTEAAAMGLISSRTASMSAARRLTATMLSIFPDDPLRGDFALFGKGVASQGEAEC